jgi:hypothetical protein
MDLESAIVISVGDIGHIIAVRLALNQRQVRDLGRPVLADPGDRARLHREIVSQRRGPVDFWGRPGCPESFWHS